MRDCQAALKTLLHQLHRCSVGTLDSFFVRIMRTFPFELGFGGAFTIVDDATLAAEQDALARELFRPAVNRAEQTQQDAFFNEFKLATFGEEQKRLADRLLQLLQDGYETFLNEPQAELWANAAHIWPNGNPWKQSEHSELQSSANDVRDNLPQLQLTAKETEKCELFLEAAVAFTPRSILPKNAEYFLQKVLEMLAHLENGTAQLSIGRRKIDVNHKPLANGFAQLARHVVGCLIENKLIATSGVHAVLSRYDALYQQRLRQAGKFTFGDVQRFLAERLGTDIRRDISYRLDTRYDHWLLDEFQDVARVQWQAVADLVDEVIQAQDDARTLFIVGDTKQAIYGWRGGEAWLMRDILNHYNRPGVSPVIRSDGTLRESRRCSQEIIAAVNAVFGNLKLHLSEKPNVVERWNSIWQEHTTAVVDTPGFVQCLEVSPQQGRADSVEAYKQRWQAVADRLLIVRPWDKGITTAVLVRNNREGIAVVEFLRAREIPVCWNGKAAVFDNPVTALLASLLRLAAHPGDSFAWEHLRMTPLAKYLTERGIATPEAIAQRTLRDIHDVGFEYVLDSWLSILRSCCTLDPFTERRLADVIALAQAFDRTGNKDPLDFIADMTALQTREHPASGTVVVMTMHLSKGLEFDMVFLPELQSGQRRGGNRLRFLRGTAADRQWLMLRPQDIVINADSVLQKAAAAADDTELFEELSLLYVAMTRAKRELCVVLTSSQSVNLAAIIERALNLNKNHDTTAGNVRVIYRNGDDAWYENTAAQLIDSPAARVPFTPSIELNPAPPRYPRRVPSAADRSGMSASLLFRAGSLRGRNLGTECHDFLRRITWCGNANELHAQLEAAALSDDARELLQHALRPESEVLHAFIAQCTSAELWQEKRFEAIVDHGDRPVWISGVFDRVVLERDERGVYSSAIIYDFKTTWVGEQNELLQDVVQLYTDQMRNYRLALAQLTGLPSAGITTKLVLLRAAHIATVS